MKLTQAQRSSLLKKVEGLVSTKFYDLTFKGNDWASIVRSHESEIMRAADSREFESAVNRMLGELRSGGLGLLSASTKIAPKNSISATFRSVETENGSR